MSSFTLPHFKKYAYEKNDRNVRRRLPEDEAQSEDPLLLGFTEQKLAEDKPSGKRPSEVKVTVII
ncbi:hypothetical protein HXA32_16640 [Salipaludibacillus agaradhaerens]|uniref:hypothetical protein n=1 Tax=Salipaludibacillus agaradhaerens TaxID=76935 RepID=UPI00215143F3|nr:hypothetical protein [Salipaludibacillus agaradhaerens]MCR6107898.1 hypothetical protein [Salipaludibacillus agaradhaerens]